MEHEISLTSLFIVTTLSFLVPLFLKKIKRIYIPVVVGEIIIGIIIGKSGFDLIKMDESLQFIQFFGLAYLMFVAGLEIDFDIFSLKSNVKDQAKGKRLFLHPLIISFLILMVTLALAYLASLVLMNYRFVNDPLLMSLIIGTTSLGIVVPILKEKKIMTTLYGQYILTIAIIADFITMLLISVAVSLFKGGLSPQLLLVLGLLVLVFVMYRISSKLQHNQLFRELAHGTTQIGIRGAFALMLLFLVLSQTIGVEMILGSFLAGTVISLASKSKREDIHHKLDAIGFGFLIPTFFILIGVNFDLNILLKNGQSLLLIPVLLLLVYIIKGFPVLIIKTLFPWKYAVAGGVLLTSKLSLTIAAAAIGVEIGAISEEMSAAILLVSIMTSLFSPMIFSRIIPEQKEEKEEDKQVIIIGTTTQAVLLAKRLANLEITVLLIESKKEKAEDVVHTGIKVVWGDAMDHQLLKEIELNRARAVVVATGSDEINYKIAQYITGEVSDQHVIILLSDPAFIEKAQLNELIRIVNPQLSTVSLLENMVRHPVAASILEDKRDLHIEEVKVINPLLTDIHLRDLRFPGDLLILSVYRNGETILPHGDTSFDLGDVVLVLGTIDDVHAFIDLSTRS